MSDTTPMALRGLLVERYDEIKVRLTKRLGSSDLASDAIQETWLRLYGKEALGAVRNPLNYLFRVALNVARDRLSAERRYLTAVQVETMFDLADEAPGPERVVETRADLRHLERLIVGLPPRQREILVAARLDGLPRQEIADRLGISLSLVEKELKLAIEYCLVHRGGDPG